MVGANESLFAAVRAWAAANYPGQLPQEILIVLSAAERPVRLPLPLVAAPRVAGEAPSELWVPTDNQISLLDALEGKGLKGDALAAAADVDRRQMFRELAELRERNLVAHHPRIGYFRPDAPPEGVNDTEKRR